MHSMWQVVFLQCTLKLLPTIYTSTVGILINCLVEQRLVSHAEKGSVEQRLVKHAEKGPD
jgi:hypothetical protein